MYNRSWRFFHDWLARAGPFIDWLLQHLDEAPRIGRARSDDPERAARGPWDLDAADEPSKCARSSSPVESAPVVTA